MKVQYRGPYLILQVNENDLEHYDYWLKTGGAFNLNMEEFFEIVIQNPKLELSPEYAEIVNKAIKYKHNGNVTVILDKLASKLNKEQLEAVIYHEIGHSAMKHSQRFGSLECAEKEIEADTYAVQFTSKKAMREAINISCCDTVQRYAHKARFVNSLYEIVFKDETYCARMKALED